MTELGHSSPPALGGRYLLGAHLGHGGMGVVRQASDLVLDRNVAVKILRDLVVEPADRARFEREGALLARLSHPGLITVYDAGVEDGQPYLVMELVEGETLAQRCRGAELPTVLAVVIARDLADILAYIHDRGIAHRDVKPSNVLIDAEWRIRLADFGVARLPETSGGLTATSTGIGIGTPAYLAPEQVRGEAATPASDVYALALVLLEALTGKPVYTGPPSMAALVRLVTPPRVPSDLPRPLQELLAEMTADQPDERPTAAGVRDRLEALATSMAGDEAENPATPPAPAAVTGTDLGPPTARLAARRWSRRVPRWALAAGAAVVAIPAMLYSTSLLGDPATTPSGEPQPVLRSSAGTSPTASPDSTRQVQPAAAPAEPVRTTANGGAAAGNYGRGSSGADTSRKGSGSDELQDQAKPKDKANPKDKAKGKGEGPKKP